MKSKNLEIDSKLLKHVAQLSRLEFSAQEEQEYLKNFSSLLKYVENLKNAPTQGVDPLYNTVEQGMMKNTLVHYSQIISVANHLHADLEKKPLSVHQILLNAPDQAENQIKINAVIEEL